MCIAVIIPQGLAIHENVIRKCADRQRHGMGFAFVGKKGKVEVYKRPDSGDKKAVEEFISIYQSTWKKGAKNHKVIMHFRSATGGDISKENAHPFLLPNGGALMHNGFLYEVGKDSKLSDTSDFVQKYGDSLTKDFVNKHKKELEEVVCTWNKIAFLWGDGTTSVLNDQDWDKSTDGLLFSNRQWRS